MHLQLCFAGTTLEDEEKGKGDKKIENASSRQTLMAIYQSATRIANGKSREYLFELSLAIFQVCTERDFGRTALNALQLLHVVHGKSWEDTATVFRQLDNIGEDSSREAACSVDIRSKINSDSGVEAH